MQTFPSLEGTLLNPAVAAGAVVAAVNVLSYTAGGVKPAWLASPWRLATWSAATWSPAGLRLMGPCSWQWCTRCSSFYHWPMWTARCCTGCWVARPTRRLGHCRDRNGVVWFLNGCKLKPKARVAWGSIPLLRQFCASEDSPA